MSLPIRPLPILEQYDCHGCGDCCYGTIIHLRDEDLKKIREQRWEEHPDYRGMQIVVSQGLFKKSHQLAKRGDGACIFLTPEGRCRIHQEFGAEAKPLICQIAPLQLVPLDQFAYLTVRRYCRSAVRDQGRSLAEHCDALRDFVEKNGAAPKPVQPPPIVRRHRRPWKQTFQVADALTRLMTDARYPLVRRLVHGLQFSGLLGRCRLREMDGSQFAELIALLELAAVKDVGVLFHRRIEPVKIAAKLFRQTALEYLRLHPRFVPEKSWRERWRLIQAAMAFARAKGPVPVFRLPFPPMTFEALERPLGHWDQSVLHPLNIYFETMVASLRFAVLGRPGWSIVESFQALGLSYAIAMWMLRLACGERAPTVEDTIQVTMMLDRGQGYAPLVGARHRFRVGVLARQERLARLAIWYAR